MTIYRSTITRAIRLRTALLVVPKDSVDCWLWFSFCRRGAIVGNIQVYLCTVVHGVAWMFLFVHIL